MVGLFVPLPRFAKGTFQFLPLWRAVIDLFPPRSSWRMVLLLFLWDLSVPLRPNDGVYFIIFFFSSFAGMHNPGGFLASFR